jgi:hypothetical protein
MFFFSLFWCDIILLSYSNVIVVWFRLTNDIQSNSYSLNNFNIINAPNLKAQIIRTLQFHHICNISNGGYQCFKNQYLISTPLKQNTNEYLIGPDFTINNNIYILFVAFIYKKNGDLDCEGSKHVTIVWLLK